MQEAIFAGGCFTCLETIFIEIEGVKQVVTGYIGGFLENPTYEQVYIDKTGHAEAVKILFDENIVSYLNLLEIFFKIHDPTTLNQQGRIFGTRYRSEIFYLSEEQKNKAEIYIKNMIVNKVFDKSIVTKITQATFFYQAEEFMQRYFYKNPDKSFSLEVINPKLLKFKKEFTCNLKINN